MNTNDSSPRAAMSLRLDKARLKNFVVRTGVQTGLAATSCKITFVSVACSDACVLRPGH